MRPAGVAAIAGALAIQIGLIIGGSALDADSTADRLLEASKGDADGQLLLGALASAAGFLLLAVPLTFFFLAARARSERVLRQLAPLGALGAVLIAAGLVINNTAYLSAADDFAASEADREATVAPAPGSDQADQKGQEDGGAEPKPAGEADRGEGGTTTVEPTTTTTETTDAEAVDGEEAEDEADDRADDAIADASGSTASAYFVRGGALAFAIGFFYAALWCMRLGLLSRFWGSLGMASAVVLALFFLYFFTLIWFLAMGLFLLGAWVGGRPPAWETGAAMPWPKAGEQPPDPGATIEGEGRELSGDAEPGELGEGTPEEPGEGPPGEPPQKRKRRR